MNGDPRLKHWTLEMQDMSPEQRAEHEVTYQEYLADQRRDDELLPTEPRDRFLDSES
jgi:hypothetical protein